MAIKYDWKVWIQGMITWYDSIIIDDHNII